MPNGHVETVVFALDCDQDFFLTSNSHGDLELNVSIFDQRRLKVDNV